MLAITLGDPLSVMSELLLDVWPQVESLACRWPVVIVGSAWQWRDQSQRLGKAPKAMTPVTSWSEPKAPGLYFLNCGAAASEFAAEQLSAQVRGDLTVATLAVLAPLRHWSGPLAVLTGPIAKHTAVLGGFAFPGQTEFFSDLWRTEAVMILAGPRLRVGLATNHLRLAAVPAALTEALVARKLLLLIDTLKSTWGFTKPRLGVVGLNPHAGDGGLFGDEEKRLIAPAIATVQEQRPDAVIRGPLPADTAFYAAYQGDYDAVLAMYHDQGLGPLKTVHFDNAVNLSGGLPHLRLSPDHGPAQDLFLRGRASSASVAAALAVCANYLEGKSS